MDDRDAENIGLPSDSSVAIGKRKSLYAGKKVG